MEDFSQLFNNEIQSIHYKSRPEYSQDIVKEIINFWKSFNNDIDVDKNLSIIDVGCGTGQLTREFIPYCNSLIGIDSSESQIKEAQRCSDDCEIPKFMVGSCYDIPVGDCSVDIITAAQCVHWFDIDKFYVEVNRCLKKSGILVISMYEKGYFIVNGVEDIHSELNKFLINDLWFDDKYLGSLVNDRLIWASKGLEGIRFLYPSTGLRNKSLAIQMVMTLRRFETYLYSTSIYQRWKKGHPNERDIIDVIMEKIFAYLGNPESGFEMEVCVKYPLNLIMCSKPSS